MNKIISTLLILCLPIFVTGCTLFKTTSAPGNTAPGDAATDKVTTNTDTNSVSKIKGSIFDLIKKEIPLKCTYTFNSGSAVANGTIFSSGGKMRSEYMVNIGGKEMRQVAVMDGSYVYSWTANDPTIKQGMKIKINPDDQTGTKNDQVKSMQEEMDYKCLPWLVDNSKFQVPTDITFTDLSESVQPAQMCAACNSLTDEEQKTSCLDSLGCN